MSSVPAIEAKHLMFRFDAAGEPLFRGLSFSVEQGETVLFLGPSGCGKSTLMYCLNRLYPDSVEGILEGEIKIFGENVSGFLPGELCRRVGIVFQDPDSQFCMTRVDEELAFSLENLCVPRAEMDERIDRALKQVGLLGCRRRRIHELSGGMKQKLAIACALAAEPKILILDEPTAQLDPWSARDIVRLIMEQKRKRGLTLLLVEHRLDEWIAHADRCILLASGGKYLDEGTPAACFAKHGDHLARLGIWVPKVSELALELRSAEGLASDECPVTEEQFAESVKHPETAAAFLDRKLQPLRREERPRVDGSELSIRDVSVRLGGKVVLDRISLAFRLGELTAIIGANGSGKTTLLQYLAGIGARDAAGSWLLDGRPLADWPQDELRRRIGYVFQNPEHQFVTFKVRDELAFGMRLRGLKESEMRPVVQRLAAECGLAGLEEANPFSLSQGQKRRLSVATMLADEQQWLLLDEPTFGQDAKTAEQLMNLLLSRVRKGMSVIMATHDMELVQQYANRVILLKDGNIRYDGSPSLLWEQEELLSECGIIPPVPYRLRRMLERQCARGVEHAALRAVESGG